MANRLSIDDNSRGRICPRCGKRMALSVKADVCPACFENEMFKKVKEYVLQNDVTEFEVADHFGIDLSLVKKWIKDGHLEHRKTF